MTLSRKAFIKKTCLGGTCLCGFTSLIQATDSKLQVENKGKADPDKELMQDWISTLLHSIEDQEDQAACRKIMKSCARSHYNHLQMDNFLQPYEGNLEKFNTYIGQQWGWKINYKKDEGLLIADENKNHCVCPMVNRQEGEKSSILCYCSEGFAELMYSKVVGHPVQATVISSVIRGDSSCQYKIKFG